MPGHLVRWTAPPPPCHNPWPRSNDLHHGKGTGPENELDPLLGKPKDVATTEGMHVMRISRFVLHYRMIA